jgi:hypothetical protein
VPLVGGSLFLLASGVANIDLWYPLPLFFPAGHYWVAWLTVGALIVHVGAKAATVRRALAPAEAPAVPDDRRRFLLAVGGASGLLTLLTAGQTVRALRGVSLLAPRHPDVGVQGFPVNGTAAAAGVTAGATDTGWPLSVVGAVPRPLTW